MGNHLGMPGAIGIPISGATYIPFPYTVLSLVMDFNPGTKLSSEIDIKVLQYVSSGKQTNIYSDSESQNCNISNKHNEICTNSDKSPCDTKLQEEPKICEKQIQIDRGFKNSLKNELTETEDFEKNKKRKIYRCDRGKCNAKFYKPGLLSDHLNIHERKRPYICKELHCTNSYCTWNHLRRHIIESHHKTVKKHSYMGEPVRKEQKPKKLHYCPYSGCGAKFARPGKLAAHICTHTGEKPFKCSEKDCDKGYTMLRHLQRHVSNVHKPRAPIIIELICTEEGCRKVYQSMESLRKHFKLHHTEHVEKTHPHKCSHCGDRFTTLKRLFTHEYARHNIVPYKCLNCNRSYTSESSLKRHQEMHQRTYPCPEAGCEEIFSDLTLFKEHKRKVHPPSNDCPSCNRKLNSQSALRAHMKTHLKVSERNIFMCPHSDCSRLYTKMFNLVQHIRVHHEGQKLPCPYPECGKSLVTKQKVQEHLKLHDPHHPRGNRKGIKKKKRSDAGKPKRAMAVKMSGIQVPLKIEKNILKESELVLKSSECTIKDKLDYSDGSSNESDADSTDNESSFISEDSVIKTEVLVPLNYAKPRTSDVSQAVTEMSKNVEVDFHLMKNNFSDWGGSKVEISAKSLDEDEIHGLLLASDDEERTDNCIEEMVLECK